MSIKIMSRVWESGPEKQADRFVLLAIADYANDEGECWPSIAGICRKTCMSERGVQTIIRRLEADGWLHIETGKGRRNCNLYIIKTPAPHAPRTTCTPHMDAETPHMDAINPAPRAPEPSYNHQEPSNRDTNVSLALFAPECVQEPDRFQEFWDQYPHRNGAKKGRASAQKAWAKAIRARASPAQIIAGALRYANDRQVMAGYAKDPATWLNQKGWEDEIEPDHGTSRQSGSGPSGSRNAMVDAFAAVAAERSARAGGR